MGKKGKKGKTKEPEDPYKDHIRLWLVMDEETSDVRLPIFLPKAYCIVGCKLSIDAYAVPFSRSAYDFHVPYRYTFVRFRGNGEKMVLDLPDGMVNK